MYVLWAAGESCRYLKSGPSRPSFLLAVHEMNLSSSPSPGELYLPFSSYLQAKTRQRETTPYLHLFSSQPNLAVMLWNGWLSRWLELPTHSPAFSPADTRSNARVYIHKLACIGRRLRIHNGVRSTLRLLFSANHRRYHFQGTAGCDLNILFMRQTTHIGRLHGTQQSTLVLNRFN